MAQNTQMTPTQSVLEQLTGRRVLVTGATGFIGSHLVSRLADLGAQVTAVGPKLGWRPIVPRLVEQGQIRFVKLGAFWNPASLRRLVSEFEEVEHLVHLGYVMPRGETALQCALDEVQRNVLGTLRLMQLLPISVSKVCFASSAMVYGLEPPLPVSEMDCTHPASAYAAGKLVIETYLRLWSKESGIPTSILRYATVYGPMETVPRAIPNFIRQVLAGKPPVIHGDGGDIRDYVHVSDVVEATLLALAHDSHDVQIYNVGTGSGHSTLEIADRITQLAGCGTTPILESRPHSACKVVCDISHARKSLGYEPRVSIDTGLVDEVQYFVDHPKLWRVQ